MPEESPPVAAKTGPGARRVAVLLAALAALGAVGGWGVAHRARPRPVKLAASEAAKTAEPSGRLVWVHVAGGVQRPGLYRLPDGSRVGDAVQAAGGTGAEADVDAVNLAARVKDGDKILVPLKGGSEPGQGSQPGNAAAGSGLVNLNTATAAELEQLPGIGPAMAKRILDYRTKHGGFRTVDELKKVPGIGDKKFADLKDLVTV